jgi:hypothetical protein
MWLLPWSACVPERPDRFLVVDGREGEYALVEARIAELADPGRMTGALGDGRVGGYLAGDLTDPLLADVRYSGGGTVRLRYSVDGGVGVPHDDDGIVLWSYYHTLSRIRADLDALGVDAGPIFPIDFAYQPSVGGVALTATNAAYVGDGVHLFVLLADAARADLPLAANPGVVRHEFGHALFQLIVAGGVDQVGPRASPYALRALNEGFADIVATTTLDDPAFLDASLSVPERRVDGAATTARAEAVDVNPYSRGTVYASLAWDLRERTDPDTALLAAVAALRAWAAEAGWQDGQAGVDGWAARFVEAADALAPEATAGLCADHTRRFGTTAPACR